MAEKPCTLKVGLKYCGGCRARYNRVAAACSIRKRLDGAVEFVAPDSEDALHILIITGCQTACATLNIVESRKVRYVTSPEDAEQWIEEILKIGSGEPAADFLRRGHDLNSEFQKG